MEGGVLTSATDYVGTELDLFATARNWKAYWSGQIAPHIGGRVLDVGAGLGATAALFAGHTGVAEWTCLERDRRFVADLAAKVSRGDLPLHTGVRAGTTADIRAQERFDAILYIDVLEHIPDDRGELARAARLLAPGAKLIVLSPAHQWLFSPFDRHVGHERRYARSRLAALAPAGLRPVSLRYLDCVGLAASFANRCLLRQDLPGRSQIRVWDRLMVPISRRLDPLLGFHAGKSVLAVWSS